MKTSILSTLIGLALIVGIWAGLRQAGVFAETSMVPVASAQEINSDKLEEAVAPKPVKSVTLTIYQDGRKPEVIKPIAVSPAPSAPCVAFVLEDKSRGIYCGTYKLIIN